MNEEKGLNFQNDLKLDKHDLDNCALSQPELYAEWALKWADAVDRRDRAKDNLNLVKSDCDVDIRENPKKFGWAADKAPTEAFIGTAIFSHPDYMAANEDYMQAVHEVNVLSIAKESFEQRRKMIEVLVQLYLSGYYSGNKDFDKGFQVADAKSTEAAKEGALESVAEKPRMQRRRLGAE